MAKILMVNGPNLNLLGLREPEIYGHTTLSEIEAGLSHMADEASIQFDSFQSNGEGELIDRIQMAHKEGVTFLLVNLGGFTHTSVALRDAILAVDIPFIELHLSNPAERESYRQRSFFSDIAVGTISGFGQMSYQLAMVAAIACISESVVTEPEAAPVCV